MLHRFYSSTAHGSRVYTLTPGSGCPLRLHLWLDGDQPDSLEEVTPGSLNANRWADYTGDYASEELGVHYPLVLENGASLSSISTEVVISTQLPMVRATGQKLA